VAPALLLVLAGCMQDHTLVKLKADGSGTLECTSMMSVETIKMLKGQMEAMAKDMGGAPAPAKEMFSEDDAKQRAATMGEGVAYVSSEPVKTPTHEGRKSIYSFKDITKVKLGTTPKPQGGPGMEAKPAEDGDVITFKFAKPAAGNAVLTAVFSEKKKAAEKKDPAEQEMAMAMMKQFMKGMKISIAVAPEGGVVKTSCPHRQGNVVTLMEMDLDEVLKDDANFKKLAGTEGMSMAESGKVLAGVPGIKVPATNEVTIEFAGK
jgi:hypothetical protein